MQLERLTIWVKEKMYKVDWNLLIFLLLFLHVKLAVKLAALVFIYWRRFDLSFKFSLKQPGLPFFYPAMIGIALVNFLVYGLFRDSHYSFLLLTGIIFWIMCILALHQVTLSVTQSSLEKLHNALLVFFVINAVASIVNIFSIIAEIGELNPYRYQGNYQKYFIGTGDYIRGITFDTSTTNAILNAFGLVYFLLRKKMVLSIICMLVLLLTCSNFTNLLIIACLVFLFIFRTNRDQKSIIMVQLSLVAVFMINVTPQNNTYSRYIIDKTVGVKEIITKKSTKEIPITQKPDSVLSKGERKTKFAQLYLDSLARLSLLETNKIHQKTDSQVYFKPVVFKINIHAPEYQHRQDSSEARLQAIAYLNLIEKQAEAKSQKIDTVLRINHPPGKLTAFKELYGFMKTHPIKLAIGNGMGRFSSKLAFRATGLKIAGGYPAAYTYVDEDFKNNHLSVYLNYFGRDSGMHSIANSPNSFYGQLLGEYGLVGVVCFVMLYVLFFAKGFTRLTYGLPVLIIMAGALVTEYWFEQLSVVVMFELLILLNRKELTLRISDKKI
jgi:hypothetical protein